MRVYGSQSLESLCTADLIFTDMTTVDESGPGRQQMASSEWTKRVCELRECNEEPRWRRKWRKSRQGHQEVTRVWSPRTVVPLPRPEGQDAGPELRQSFSSGKSATYWFVVLFVFFTVFFFFFLMPIAPWIGRQWVPAAQPLSRWFSQSFSGQSRQALQPSPLDFLFSLLSLSDHSLHTLQGAVSALGVYVLSS